MREVARDQSWWEWWVPAQLMAGLPMPLTREDRLEGKVGKHPRYPPTQEAGGAVYARVRLNVRAKTCWWK